MRGVCRDAETGRGRCGVGREVSDWVNAEFVIAAAAAVGVGRMNAIVI